MVCIPDSILCDATIPPTARLILCIIASRADDTHCAAEMSRKQFVECLGVCEDTVRRSLRLLQNRGLIEAVPQTLDSGAYGANIWLLVGAEVV